MFDDADHATWKLKNGLLHACSTRWDGNIGSGFNCKPIGFVEGLFNLVRRQVTSSNQCETNSTNLNYTPGDSSGAEPGPIYRGRAFADITRSGPFWNSYTKCFENNIVTDLPPPPPVPSPPSPPPSPHPPPTPVPPSCGHEYCGTEEPQCQNCETDPNTGDPTCPSVDAKGTDCEICKLPVEVGGLHEDPDMCDNGA